MLVQNLPVADSPPIEDRRASDEKLGSPIDEKHNEAQVSVEEDVTDADEALGLVGMRRTAEFSEEYYKKLRRKLVCSKYIRIYRLFSK